MRLGCHLTITKGLDKAAQFAHGIEANTFQYFTRNPRGGARREIAATEVARWEKARAAYDVFPVVGHLPYTVNLAAPPGRLMDFAAMVLAEDMARVGAFGGEFLVSHPGRQDGERQDSLQRLVHLVDSVLQQDPGGPVLCLETMALQGSELGSIDDFGWVLRELHAGERVGVWLDSAHLFAAGWDIGTQAGCDRLVDALDKRVGLNRVRGMHLNDSKVPAGSHKDRHANLGQGELGLDGIAAIVNNPFLGTLPLILETPVNKYEEYQPEIALARSLAQVS